MFCVLNRINVILYFPVSPCCHDCVNIHVLVVNLIYYFCRFEIYNLLYEIHHLIITKMAILLPVK